MVLIAFNAAASEARQAAPPQSTMVTTSIQIDGVAVRVRSSLAPRHGAPVVVFESGASIPLDTWDPLLEKVAALAPVVAYDRPGTGQTPWDNQPFTPQRANERLRKLLDALKVTSPIVLVGHSWGGALSRYFVAEYPQMVKAVLYIDPTDVTMTEPMWEQMFASFGASPQDLNAFFKVMDTSTTSLPAAVRAESLAMMELLRTRTLEERRLKPAPAIPSSVILAGRIAPLPKGMVPFDGEAYSRALQSTRVTGLRSWARAGGQYVVVDGAGHFVYRDAPDVVFKEIQRLVAGAEPLKLQARVLGDGAPVVLLGGGLLGADGWGGVPQVLARARRVINLQSIAAQYGLEDRVLPPGYSLQTEVDAVKGTLQDHPSGPVDLIGMSHGGVVAMVFALQNPQSVRSLTLVEPPAFWLLPNHGHDTPGAREMQAFVSSLRNRAIEEADVEQFRCLLGDCVDGRSPRQLPQWPQWVKYRHSLRGLHTIGDYNDDPQRLRSLRIPALIVTGAKTVAFHRLINDTLLKMLPAAEALELGAGHNSPASDPENFVAGWQKFQQRRGGAR